MVDFIFHILGICPDHFNHFNMIDLPLQDLTHLFNHLKNLFKK